LTSQPCRTVGHALYAGASTLPLPFSPLRFPGLPERYQYASIERIPNRRPTRARRAVSLTTSSNNSSISPRNSGRRASSRVHTSRRRGDPHDDVRVDIAMDDAMMIRLLSETDHIITTYFEMEDPTKVTSEGVELRLGVTINGRHSSASWTVGPRRRWNPHDRRLQDRWPAKSQLRLPNRSPTPTCTPPCAKSDSARSPPDRLMYVAKGESIERNVSDVVVRARSQSARAWEKINRFYGDGDFRRPVGEVCRFCSYKDLCRAQELPYPSEQLRSFRGSTLVWRLCNSTFLDYRCPFAKNIHLHVVTALRVGADLTSTSCVVVESGSRSDGAPDVWNDPAYDGESYSRWRPGFSVRDQQSEYFLDAHEALFRARHDRGSVSSPRRDQQRPLRHSARHGQGRRRCRLTPSHDVMRASHKELTVSRRSAYRRSS